MTTQSWAHNFNHDGDAGFRAWGDDFNTRLAAIGLVQTADTGQIDWDTVNRPGAATMAGYEIWRFDDAVQATAPIFLRFDYGTDDAANRARIDVTVGTGSDGSGNLTGTTTSAYEITPGDGNMTGEAATSFFCHVAGFLGLVWGKDGPEPNLNWATLFLCRTCDALGDPTADGAFVMYCNGEPLGASGTGSVANASIDFANSVVWEGATQFESETPVCLIPGHVDGALLPPGDDTPVWPFWGAKPDAFPVFGLCAVDTGHIAETGTFTASPIGTSSHTFINIGDGGFDGTPWSVKENANDYGTCMIWE